MRVLIVEDDLQLGDGLLHGLRAAGFAADWVRDGTAADRSLLAESFSVVVLDLGLPGIDGRDLLQRLRARGDRTPVLVLTSRDAVEDRIAGLDGGADDYLVKPVAIAELAARLRALARRAAGEAAPILTIGALQIDPAAHSVCWHGTAVELGTREFAVLEELARNAGRVLSREQLESRLYEWDRALESNAIEVHVHHLRRKLAPELIRTIRGVGYLMPRAPGEV
ncbi:MAG: response regulator transcription factor [Pseudomonadales bacterium]|nr:response regulator transcription factor [Pseudomonadales bacterium]